MKSSEKLLQPERFKRIRSLPEEKKTVTVSDLSEACDVSENTIRRDLRELEEGGIGIRIKGGAIYPRQKL